MPAPIGRKADKRGGQAKAVDKPCRDDAKHARMEILPRDEQEIAGGVGGVAEDPVEDVTLDAAAFLVEGDEWAGEGGVAQADEAVGELEAAETPGGIDAGDEAEGDLLGGGGQGKALGVGERAEARVGRWAGERAEALGDE